MKFLMISLLSGFLFLNFAQAKSIMVGGSAVKSIDPNIIVVNFEVWAKGANAKSAQQVSASEYQRVKKVFESFKIEKKDIQTESYSLAPEYTYDQKVQQNKMTGFRVGQTLSVTLRKTDEVGAFLDGLISSTKANDHGVSVSSVNWDSDKRGSAEIASLAAAVQDAKQRAEEIAQAAGVKIKGILNISHNVQAPAPQPMARTFMAKSISMDGGGPQTELSAGQIKIRVEVQAEYEI